MKWPCRIGTTIFLIDQRNENYVRRAMAYNSRSHAPCFTHTISRRATVTDDWKFCIKLRKYAKRKRSFHHSNFIRVFSCSSPSEISATIAVSLPNLRSQSIILLVYNSELCFTLRKFAKQSWVQQIILCISSVFVGSPLYKVARRLSLVCTLPSNYQPVRLTKFAFPKWHRIRGIGK